MLIIIRYFFSSTLQYVCLCIGYIQNFTSMIHTVSQTQVYTIFLHDGVHISVHHLPPLFIINHNVHRLATTTMYTQLYNIVYTIHCVHVHHHIHSMYTNSSLSYTPVHTSSYTLSYTQPTPLCTLHLTCQCTHPRTTPCAILKVPFSVFSHTTLYQCNRKKNYISLIYYC